MIASKKHNLTTMRLCVTLLMLGCIIFGAVLPAAAASYPKPSDKVADEAGVLSEYTIRMIKSENKELAADVGASIAVCTVKTTGDTDIADYTRAVFKEWKLGEGVLLLIAADDNNYYFMQSVGVDKIITNEVLTSVRDGYLEEDFAAGNIDRGVLKTVSRLSALLVSGLEDAVVDDTEENTEDPAEKGTTFGSVLVGFFKVILWIVVIAVVLLGILFVAALFNDDAAEIFSFVWQTVILRKGNNKSYSMPNDYYDERLYGSGNRSAQRNPNAQRRPNQPQNRRPQNNIQQSQPNHPALQDGRQRNYPQNQNRRTSPMNPNQYRQPQNRMSGTNSGANSGVNPAVNPAANPGVNPAVNHTRQTYYNADGTPRQPRQNQGAQYSNNRYNNSNQQFGDETRQFIIPGREQNRR